MKKFQNFGSHASKFHSTSARSLYQALLLSINLIMMFDEYQSIPQFVPLLLVAHRFPPFGQQDGLLQVIVLISFTN